MSIVSGALCGSFPSLETSLSFRFNRLFGHRSTSSDEQTVGQLLVVDRREHSRPWSDDVDVEIETERSHFQGQGTHGAESYRLDGRVLPNTVIGKTEVRNWPLVDGKWCVCFYRGSERCSYRTSRPVHSQAVVRIPDEIAERIRAALDRRAEFKVRHCRHDDAATQC